MALCPLSGAGTISVRKIHLGPIAPPQSPYIYVPFDVPAGAEEVTLYLDYDHAGGENAIDFAVFDARFSGREDDLTGYRGKNPNRIPLISVIGRTHASYGHVAGPLPPGVWRVMFYVYKTQQAGVDVTLRISVASANQPISAPFPAWLKGDLHAHTLHSDGLWTVASLSAAAEEAGLNFVAITDHNVATHHAEIDSMPAGGPLLLKGIELTTYGGHMNVWGVPSGTVLEHRQLPGDNMALQRTVARAHELGALISINHPFAKCKACDWAFDRTAASFDGIEVWNGAWTPDDQLALEWWDRLLRGGRHIPAIGSSDTHGPQNPLGTPTLHLYAQRADSRAILEAIAEMRATITRAPSIEVNLEASSAGSNAGIGETLHVSQGSPIDLHMTIREAPPGEVILFSQAGEVRRWISATAKFDQSIRVNAGSGYYRLEARDPSGDPIALTNPVWIETSP